MGILRFIYKVVRRLRLDLTKFITNMLAHLLFMLNDIEKGKSLRSFGIPVVSNYGRIKIGENCRLNNGSKFNIIGRQQKCMFIVGKRGSLYIGNNIGMSATAIVCYEKIEIGHNVVIGGGTVLYDTDFHSLDPNERKKVPEGQDQIATKPIFAVS